ncbi:dehydrogenase, partial [Paeniclostridium sordellii]|nr:dehydrogenase [Paeniclostridium sordellii]
CQVPVEKIYAAARMYATAKPAAILWGLAVDQKTDGMQNSQVTVDLMAITGNLDVPGGQILPGAGAGHNESGFGFEKGVGDELQKKMIGLEQYPAYCMIILNAHADLMLHALETGDPYPIKMGFYAGSCDIFLPLSTVAEREGTVFTHYAPCTVTAGFMHKAIEVGETMTDFELCYELGRRLRPEVWEDFASAKEFMEALRLGKKEGGAYFDKVSQNVVCQIPVEYYKYERGQMRQDGQPGFATPTGRVELWSTAYNQFGEDPLPFYIEPEFSPVSKPELAEEYPLVLTTGARTTAFFHSEHRQIPYLRELNPDPIMEINPVTAQRYGVSDGQWVRMWNMFGECFMKARVSEIVDEKTVHAQHGWWFPELPEEDPWLGGWFISNINMCTDNAVENCCKLSGVYNMKLAQCKVYKAAEAPFNTFTK